MDATGILGRRWASVDRQLSRAGTVLGAAIAVGAVRGDGGDHLPRRADGCAPQRRAPLLRGGEDHDPDSRAHRDLRPPTGSALGSGGPRPPSTPRALDRQLTKLLVRVDAVALLDAVPRAVGSVELPGELIVGQPVNWYGPGVVYTYGLSAVGEWQERARLMASDSARMDDFGRALALGRIGRSAEERSAWKALLDAWPKSTHAKRAQARLAELDGK